jgi:membrane protein implicated in regulation of membrane protease activity
VMLMNAISWQWIWLALGIVLLITEVATTAFVVLPLAIGAFAAATVAFFGGPVDVQFVVAAAVSVVSFAGIRPLAKRVNQSGQVEGIGSHRLTNARGVAISDIDRTGTGMVQIGGEQWHGATVDDLAIAQGADVRIVGVEGSKVLVVPYRKLPGGPGHDANTDANADANTDTFTDDPPKEQP